MRKAACFEVLVFEGEPKGLWYDPRDLRRKHRWRRSNYRKVNHSIFLLTPPEGDGVVGWNVDSRITTLGPAYILSVCIFLSFSKGFSWAVSAFRWAMTARMSLVSKVRTFIIPAALCYRFCLYGPVWTTCGLWEQLSISWYMIVRASACHAFCILWRLAGAAILLIKLPALPKGGLRSDPMRYEFRKEASNISSGGGYYHTSAGM